MSDKIEIPADVAKWYVAEYGNYENPLSYSAGKSVYDAFKAALWKPPVVTVPWIDVKEHPHPTDAKPFLAFVSDVVDIWYAAARDPYVTHWCPLPLPPETAPKSPWRSVDDPPESETATVWVCGGVGVAGPCTFTFRYDDRTHWAPFVKGEPMPPLPEGVER